MLRAALHALNGQRNAIAIGWLEQVLHEEPCNLKANYALQLAYLRSDRRRDLERMVLEIAEIYKYLQMPTKTIVLSSSYENAMLAAFREHDLRAAHEFELKVKSP